MVASKSSTITHEDKNPDKIKFRDHRRFSVQAWKPTIKHEVQSIPRSVPINYEVSKILEGVLWTVKKLKTKVSNTELRSVRNARLTQASV